MQNNPHNGINSKNSLTIFTPNSQFYKTNIVIYNGSKLKNNNTRNENDPDILYPYFLQASEYTNSNYWKKIFRLLSIGKLSKIKIRGYDLIYEDERENKFDSITIDENLKVLYTDVKKFISKNLNFYDIMDNDDNTERVVYKKKSRWIDIKKDSSAKISEFVNNFKLSPSNKIEAIKDIGYAIQAKFLNNDNIIVEDDKIVKILGLKIINGKLVLDYSNVKKEKLKSRKYTNTIITTVSSNCESKEKLTNIANSNFYSKYCKYLSSCVKKQLKN